MSKNSLQSRPQHFPSVTKYRDRRPKAPKPSFGRRLKYIYWRLVRLQGQPETIARGLACGVFAGLFPLFGLQTLIGVVLAFFLRGNKIIAAAGTWVSNPLTYVPIYAFNFHVGKQLLRLNDLTDVSLNSWVQVKELGADILFTLFVGCFVVGLFGAVISYFLGLWFIRRSRSIYSIHRRHRSAVSSRHR